MTKTQENIQESQEVTPFLVGDYKAARKRQDSITKTKLKHKQQKGSTKEAAPWDGQKLSLEGLNMFNGTNRNLNSDVDQDTEMFGSHDIS